MNVHLPLTDDAIRAAIARRATSGGDDDLRERVLAAAAAVPQRRGWRVRVDDALSVPERRTTRTLALAVVLLLATALGAALVGSLIDRTSPSPVDGLVYLSGGDLWVAGPDGKSPRLVWDAPETLALSQPMWVNAETILIDARRVADGMSSVYLVDIATSAPRLVVDGGELLALSPDHRRIATAQAVVGAASRLRIIDLATGSLIADLGEVESSVPLSWSPDDRWLLGEGSREGDGGLIYRVDLQSGDVTELATGLCCGLHSKRPALSPDGSRVVFVDHHQAAQGEICDFRCGTLWGLDVDTGARERLTDVAGSEIGPIYSADGTWIAFMEKAIGPIVGYDVSIVRPDGTGRQKLTNTGDAFPPTANDEPYRYLAWDPGGGGLTFMRGLPHDAQLQPFGQEFELWHVTLDGQAEQRIGSFVVSEFSR